VIEDLQKRVPRDVGAAALVGVATLVAAVIINIGALTSFQPAGDDFGPILDSAHQFDPSVSDWFREGYREYFVHYPELSRRSSFIRPTTNASLWLESWLFDPSSRWMLTINYVGHAIATGLVFFISRRMLRLTTPAAVLASAVFAFSASTTALFTSPPFRSDMLATVLGAAAILIVWSRAAERIGKLLWLVLILTFASIYAKATGFATPFMVAATLALCGGGDERLSIRSITARAKSRMLLIGVTLVPAAVYLINRAALPKGTIYVIDEAGETIGPFGPVISNILRFFATTFIPLRTNDVKDVFSGDVGESLGALAGRPDVAAALLLNAVFWILLIRVVVRARQMAVYALPVTLGAIASVIPLALKAEPRFMYMSQLWLVPVGVALFMDLRDRAKNADPPRALIRAAGTAMLGVVIAVGVVANVAGVAAATQDNAEMNDYQEEFAAELTEVLKDQEITRVYSLNERVGAGARARLQYHTARENRTDVAVRIIARVGGPVVAPGGAITFEPVPEGDQLRILIDAGEGQELMPGISDDDLALLGDPALVTYDIDELVEGTERSELRRLEVTIPELSREDFAILWSDPVTGHVRTYQPVREPVTP
jgi:hypothetical protein